MTRMELLRTTGIVHPKLDLNSSGRIVSVVSTPEIYTHEWASFSTKDYPENLQAKTGDMVRIVTTEFADSRPAEDVLWTEEAYNEVYSRAGLEIVAQYKPLATGKEPYHWVSETEIAPWSICSGNQDWSEGRIEDDFLSKVVSNFPSF
jgi:hypothetical protein